ncbi:hypothetical protein PRIPAC_96942 [Pristionchus pacificus]|nr:hypothetical protein PRIPAC_96942 [Pristionchus pacificus]
MRPIFLLLSLFCVVNSYKFLVYSSQSGKSHVNFLARITDILVDAGHEVVMLSPIMNSLIGGPMTDKARVIEIPQCKESAEFEDFINNQMSQNVWTQSPFRMFFSQSKMFENWVKTCESVIHHPGLIEQLKAEKFDAAFGESFEACGPVVFHLVGIEKWAVTESIAIRDGGFYISQTPGNPAYVPSLMAGSKDEMSFFDRLLNTFSHVVLDFMMEQHYPMMAERIRQSYPDLPEIREIIATNSLVFLNSEPLVDFPKITSARVIDYGGIVTSSEHKPLNQTWSSILDLRPRTVLLSFGTVARAHAMPEQYKQTIRETFRKFPNVTFIWKYEKPEDKVSDGIPNLIESTWVPQRDMLHDARLSAFITHCGQGSTTESIDAGIPLIVIPVLADQLRNAHQIERNRIGMRLEKTDLAGGDKLERAIREVLDNDSYRKTAKKVREMIADRPFAMKEIFVKNMEFLAKHGPLRQLDHYGRRLNFFQYYLVDDHCSAIKFYP